MNAKKELIKHIEDRKVKYVHITRNVTYAHKEIIEGTLDEVSDILDFDYSNGYGSQELEGTIWYEDGTWSDRCEYDGSEWWKHRKCPEIPNKTK